MEYQSIIYGSIVFLALVFSDLGVTGVAAISGPLAALILEYEAIRKQRESATLSLPETKSASAPTLQQMFAHYPVTTGLAKDSEQLVCG